MRYSLPALLATIMLAGVLAPPCQAFSDPWNRVSPPPSGHYLAARQADIGADAAADRVRRATGGRVLSVRKGKRGTYRVKVLLPGGRVRNVAVDGRTGRVLD